MELTIVLPAFNEAANLEWLLPQLVELLGTHASSHELVVVDDGSEDGTRLVMERLVAALPTVRYVRLARNFGKEIALTAGLQKSRGHAVILMDSDAQHPMSLIPQMLKHWREGYEMVYAFQEKRPERWIVRLLKAWFYRLMSKTADVPIPPDAGDYRLLDRKVVDVLNSMPERNRFMKGLYSWPGFRRIGLPFEPAARRHGSSQFGLWRLTRLGIAGFTAFSVLPLRIVSLAGLMVSVIAISFGLFIVFEWLWFGQKIDGFATLAAGMMFLSGLQLMALGVVGEYLGRVFEEVKRRPLFVVAEEIAGAKAQ